MFNHLIALKSINYTSINFAVCQLYAIEDFLLIRKAEFSVVYLYFSHRENNWTYSDLTELINYQYRFKRDSFILVLFITNKSKIVLFIKNQMFSLYGSSNINIT